MFNRGFRGSVAPWQRGDSAPRHFGNCVEYRGSARHNGRLDLNASNRRIGDKMMKPTRLATLTCIGLLATLPALAQHSGGGDAASPQRTHTIVAEDYFSLDNVAECRFSPDGSMIAYASARWDKDLDRRNTDLWVVETASKEVRRLTFDPAGDGSPQWSPDGRWLYLSSGRKRAGEDKPPYDGKTQVWRIRPDGTGLMPVTRVAKGIEAFQLSADGRAVYYQTSEEDTGQEWGDLKKKYGKLEYGHGIEDFSQIWKLNLADWREEKLIDPKRVIVEFAVTDDQRRVAMITHPTGELITYEGRSTVDVYDAATKQITTLPDGLWREEAPSPYGWILGLAWSGDGRSLAFRVDFDGYPGEIFVAHFSSGDEPTTVKLIRHDEMTPSGGHLQWLSKSHDLCFTAESRARDRVYAQRMVPGAAQSKPVVLTPGDVCVNTFDVSRGGDALAIVMADVTHPPDVFTVPIAGRGDFRYDRLTNANPQVDTWKLPQISLVQWKSTDGTEVEGILELPPDYQPGTALPMVVELHGGPTASTRYELRFWIYGRTLMASRGYALLSPNYRGSTGYGDKFLTDLIGRENDIEVEDIITGVEVMIERGIADKDRLAVMGWSNGGYLTNCLITRPERIAFKAASSGAGVFDMAMQWLAEDTPGHVVNYQKGFPWNQTELMRRSSPLYNVDKVRTPTLIHVGEKDERCPPEHSRGLYRALHHYLNVPCELVVYPGAGHGLTTYEHRKAKMEWDQAWFDKYVTEPGAKPEEAATGPS
ncbi:MAG: S9 family peptidase [Phycisphaerales bacterium]|nr:MAG: S9 family peptidase [Phycisphaerales bacterium]